MNTARVLQPGIAGESAILCEAGRGMDERDAWMDGCCCIALSWDEPANSSRAASGSLTGPGSQRERVPTPAPGKYLLKQLHSLLNLLFLHFCRTQLRGYVPAGIAKIVP